MLLVNYFTMLLVTFTTITQAKHDYCSENFSVSDLPYGIALELKSFLINGTLRHFFGCKNVMPLNRNSIQLNLFNRENKNKATILNATNVQSMDTTKKTIVLLHGWLCNISNDRIPELKNAYLERYDCNVIAVDWSKISVDLYANVFCNLPQVANVIGNFFCNLEIDFQLIHLIGHSMGGQLCGLVGQEVQIQCEKLIGRITALDPAGPLYGGLDEDQRLDETDAKFVDVIHTNGGFFGYLEPCGTVDFYPNCGVLQPGCMSSNVKTITELFTLQFHGVACSHLRSCDLMIASIQGHKFYANHCDDCISILNGPFCFNGENDEEVLMGEDCRVNETTGKYNLLTGATYPFDLPKNISNDVG